MQGKENNDTFLQPRAAPKAHAPVLLRSEGLTVKYALERDWFGKAKSTLTAVDQVGFELKKGQHKEYLLWLEEGLNYLKWNNPRYSLSDESKITLLNRLIRGKKPKT